MKLIETKVDKKSTFKSCGSKMDLLKQDSKTVFINESGVNSLVMIAWKMLKLVGDFSSPFGFNQPIHLDRFIIKYSNFSLEIHFIYLELLRRHL